MKYRRLLAFVISAVMLITAVPVMAEEHVFDIYNGVLTSYSGPGGEVVIPDGVEFINQYTFRRSTGITKIVVPGSVKEIDIFTFSGMESLVEVSLTEGLEKIGNGAFSRCEKLESIILPSTVSEIGERTFQYCSSLSYAELSPSLKTVPDYAFFSCTSLTQVVIPEGVEELQFDVFGLCESLDRIDLPSSLRIIGKSAFYCCFSLDEVNISNGTTTIKDGAFKECVDLVEIDIPKTVTLIENSAFDMCTSLQEIRVNGENTAYTSVNGVLFDKKITDLLCYPTGKTEQSYIIPSSVKTIKEDAFGGLNLKELTLPDNLSEIEYDGICCQSLTTVNIPAGLADIDLSELKKCSALSEFNVDENNTAYAEEDSVLYSSDMKELKIVPTSYSGSFVVRDGVERIADNAFERCENITEVILPEGLKSIGEDAFAYCYGITELTVPYGTESMHVSPDYCGIRKMVIPPTVKEFGSYYVIIEPYPAKPAVYCVKGSPAEEYANSVLGNVYYIYFWVDSDGRITEYYGDGKTLCVPDDVTGFADGVFDNANDITLYCTKGSVTEKYATDNGISFVSYDVAKAGDTNGDAEINLSDVSCLMKYVAGWDISANVPASDVDNDGNANLNDVSLIMKYIAGWGVKLK